MRDGTITVRHRGRDPQTETSHDRPDPELIKLARGAREVVWDCLPMADDLTDALVSAEATAGIPATVDPS